jgi:tetratricopeptide (TPR) repeat protein/transcriptional regulator with XRE-family HTH domain
MAKKGAHGNPNQLLRRARLERGWTQRMVAERIGAPNDVIVTRWERGTTFPSPHYVQRLCELFEESASELGLIKEAHAVMTSHQLPRSQPLASEEDGRAPSTPRHSIPLLSALPLIGREADMSTLQARYQDVQQRRMQVVLIQGETGIGKTRLASTFLDWAAAEGATLLTGRAFEVGGRLPYQPLVHALSRCLEAEQAPEALLSATWLSELSRILPELRERYPYLPEVGGDEMTARIRLFEAVTRLGQAFCERDPVVLFIDDLHRADAASLDVLHYAAQRWNESGTPLLLLLSFCSVDLALASSFSRWVLELHHDMPVTDLTLGPLSQEETLHLLEATVRQQPLNSSQHGCLTEIGKWLFRETAGQPFYLVETLKDLLERQILTLHPTSQGEALELDMAALSGVQEQSMLPAGVRRLILSQVDRLTAVGRALLMASAILEQAASFELLCRVADLEEHDALAALDEVVRHGLLREVSEEHSRGACYLPGHDKIREVVTTEMGEAQRLLLHRRAFLVLEAQGRPAAELAHHALEGGLTEQAASFSQAAGDEAVRLFATAEARLHYTQALEALALLPETASTQSARVATLLKLIRISWMVEEVAQTLERLAAAEHLAQTLHDHRQLAAIQYWTGVVYGTRSATRQAREYAERALRAAQELGDEELVALACVQLSRVLSLQGQFGPIEELLTSIIPVLERTANWSAWTDALGCLGLTLAARGQCMAGVAQGRRAVERAWRAGELKDYNEIKARHFLSITYLYCGDLARMLEENDQVLEAAQRMDDRLLLYRAYGFRGWAQARLGKHEEAMQSMERAQAAASQVGGHILGQDTLRAVDAELLLAAGRVEEALVRAEATIELARNEVGGILGEGMAERVCGQALARLSCWEEAETHLATSIQTLLSGECWLEAARTHVVWGLLCRDHGDEAAAQAHFEQACAQFEASGLTQERETVRTYLADMVES